MTVILLRMVAPSFVMMTSPFAAATCDISSRSIWKQCWKVSRRDVLSGITHVGYAMFGYARMCKLMILTILSMPLGPRLVRTASATAFAASMFASRTSFFLVVSLVLYRAIISMRS